MEMIEILGIDPSLRYTGYGILPYNAETREIGTPTYCGVLANSEKYKGCDKILHMLQMIEELSQDQKFLFTPIVIVESPTALFNLAFAAGSMVSVGHIAGGAAALFGLARVKLVRPAEWNRRKNKTETQQRTQSLLGKFDEWGFKKHVPRGQKEHVIDAISMALWYIQKHFLEEEEEPKKTKRRLRKN